VGCCSWILGSHPKIPIDVSYNYSAHILKGGMAAYGSGTIVAAIGPHGPIRGPISSHSAALLPRISQVCFSGGINGYNTVPLCSVLAHFTYKNTQFQLPKALQPRQILKFWKNRTKVHHYYYTSIFPLF
jgi:hypothetical protein